MGREGSGGRGGSKGRDRFYREGGGGEDVRKQPKAGFVCPTRVEGSAESTAQRLRGPTKWLHCSHSKAGFPAIVNCHQQSSSYCHA